MLRQSVRLPLRNLVSKRLASTHSLSNATVANLEKRWEEMPESDQKELVSLLAERQQLSWTELTPAEKKATWYISYGTWGPRRPLHPEGEGMKIFGGVCIGLAAGLSLYAFIRQFAAPPSKTMTREWQEASDEYLKSKNAEPFQGYSQIQSK